MVFYLSGYAWVGPVHSCCVFIEHNYFCYVLYMAQLYVQGHLRHILFSFGKSSRNMERKFIEIESKNRIRERICSFLSMVFQFGVGRQYPTPQFYPSYNSENWVVALIGAL